MPTPECITGSLAALLQIPQSCVALDPCCGTGDALIEVVPDGRLYGIELEVERAQQAAKTLRHVIAGAMQEARVSNGSFGLILANPPYDVSTEGRLEKIFLERCLSYLCDGGILIWIISLHNYGPCENLLRRHFDVLGHWRFPDGYFDGPELSFRQTVLVASKRSSPNVDPRTETRIQEFRDEVLRLGSLDPMPDFRTDPPKSKIPVPMGYQPKLFHPGQLSDADIEHLLKDSPVPRKAIRSVVMRYGRPPMPLKQGHLALVLASGAIDGVYGKGSKHHVAKGTVVRTVKKEQIRERTDGGGAIVIDTETNSFAVKVRALHPDGSISDMTADSESEPSDEEMAAEAEARAWEGSHR